MKNQHQNLSKYLSLLLILFSIQCIVCQTIYDFETDTSGSTPLNITAANGTLTTDNDGVRTQTMHPLTATTGSTASYNMDLFPSSSDYSVIWKETYTTATRSGFTLRASGSNSFTSGLKQGYLFQASPALGHARIFRSNASGFSILATLNLAASGANIPRWYRATAEGTTLTFEYSDNGGTTYTLIGTAVDATYSSGTTQFSIGYNSGVPDTYIDDIVFSEMSSTQDITINNISEYQVFQRDGSNHADILISGTYLGNPTGIEASFNGGTYVTIDSSPSGGIFTGTLPNQLAGQGTLTVRFTNDLNTNVVLNTVGIGDIFVIAGQSNASGRGVTLNSYTHPTLKATMFGNDDTWKELTDATDSNTGQIDAVSDDGAIAKGSPWPTVATNILANTGVPVAFIPTSKGGTSSTQWQPGADHSNPSTLYGSMNRRMHAVGGVVAGVLFYQGESDATSNGSNLQASYESRLNTIVNTIASDFPGTKTMIGQIGFALNTTFPGKDQIRAGQIEVVASNSNALLGPATYDIDLSDEGGDNIHFKSNLDMARFTARWIAAIDKEFYNGLDGYGPILDESNLVYNTTLNKIIVPFIDDSSPAINSGSTVSTSSFDLKNNGVSVSISSVTIVDDTIEIIPASTLSSALPITLTYASLNTAVDAAIYDSNNLPARPFFDATVLVSNAVPPVITLNGASTITLTVGSVYTELGATAMDAIDGDITSNITILDNVDVNTVGSYTVTYSVSNAAGNTDSVTRTVNVNDIQDTTPPVITLNGASTIILTVGDVYTELGATATDAIDGNITSNIVISGSVDTNTPGNYTVTYTVNDAAGNTANTNRTAVVESAIGSTTTLHEGFFESGWDGWSDGGSDCTRYSGSRSAEGSYSIRLRDNSGTGSAMTSQSFNLTTYDTVEVAFAFYPNSMENGEDFWLRYYNGATWVTVATYARGTDFENNSVYTDTVTLSASSYNFVNNAQFRFQCDASGNADRIYIDQVSITGINGSGSAKSALPTINKNFLAGSTTETLTLEASDNFEADFKLYPNPVKNSLNVKMLDGEKAIFRIVNLLGKIVKSGQLEEGVIDVSYLETGLYAIEINNGKEIKIKKFIKK